MCMCECECVSVGASKDVFQKSRAQGHLAAAAPLCALFDRDNDSVYFHTHRLILLYVVLTTLDNSTERCVHREGMFVSLFMAIYCK